MASARWSTSRRAATDTPGSALAPGSEVRRAWVEPTAERTDASKWLAHAVRPGSEHLVALTVRSGRALRGRVVDADGVPFLGAEDLGWCGERADGEPHRRATTGADGAFMLESLGGNFVAVARHASMVCERGLRGTIHAPVELGELEIRMGPSAGHRQRKLAFARLGGQARPTGSVSIASGSRAPYRRHPARRDS